MSEAYHASPAISRGALNTANKSWNLFYLRHELKTVPPEEEPGIAVLKGEVTHVALLQPELLARYVIIPPTVLTTNGQRRGRAWQQFAADAAAAGRKPIPYSVAETATMMAYRVTQALGSSVLAAKQRWCELPIFWKEGPTECKALLDFVYFDSAGEICILDLKTADNLSDAAFERKSREWGYWLQDVHYRAAAEEQFERPVFDFVFVCVESSPPFRVRLKRFEEGMFLRSKARRDFLLDEIVRRRGENDWSEPGEDEIAEISHRL